MTSKQKDRILFAILGGWGVLQVALAVLLGFKEATPLVYITALPMFAILVWLIFAVPDKN